MNPKVFGKRKSQEKERKKSNCRSVAVKGTKSHLKCGKRALRMNLEQEIGKGGNFR